MRVRVLVQSRWSHDVHCAVRVSGRAPEWRDLHIKGSKDEGEVCLGHALLSLVQHLWSRNFPHTEFSE